MSKPRASKICCAAVTLCLMALGACTKDDDAKPREAVAKLTDSNGKGVGEATFEMGATGVKIEFNGHGLTPGSHGFHIHEVGKCDPPSFDSAGEHFNPTNASPGPDEVGFLPYLQVAADGTVKYEAMVKGANLDEKGPRSLLSDKGTALVIHQQTDDPDPAKPEPRIACGVIQAGKG
ncbi:Superoxide dismutase precursor [Enhygromyxa salina]|uniref:Superoxide dismutase n=1 Tax=Enhygromyxa salina TaxID=215803 RepID=A0A0C2D4M2_9BACT|nr:superoxide dismutase family protein [Enhygromyxa salina]KIG16630.1 Superoxide dismutase precursor [Enhygromyxa salina]